MKVNEIITVGNDGYSYTCGYFTSNKWLGETSVALARSRDKNIGSGSELVIYDLAQGEIKIVADNLNSWLDYAVFQKKVYYLSGSLICVYDAEDGASKVLFDMGDFQLGSPHITADGRFMSLFSYSAKEGMRAYRFDIARADLEFIFARSFPEPFPIANHLMICPTNENVFFFAHEGDTRFVSDRLWIYDAIKGESRNIAKQTVNDDGVLETCFGHEAWSHDGKGIYFVKYELSHSNPKGICYTDIEKEGYEILYTDFEYWHTGVSEDGKYLGADTTGESGFSSVILIDAKSGEQMLIEKVASRKSHPNHPHPAVSPEASALIYNCKINSDFDGVRIALLEK